MTTGPEGGAGAGEDGAARRPRAVLFDLDGTLVDTNYLHALTWWRAPHQHGHDVPMARIHRPVGMGGAELLGRCRCRRCASPR